MSPRAARCRYGEKYPACQFAQDTTPSRSCWTSAVGAGAVRVRPAAEVTPSRRKRYQYDVPAASPVTSTFTVWSRSGPVVTVPERTTRLNAWSVATCQRTVTTGPVPEPGSASGVGVTRVHSTTQVGSGSPDATPCRKYGDDAELVAMRVPRTRAPAPAPADARRND